MAALPQLELSDGFNVGSGDWSGFCGSNNNSKPNDIFLNLTLDFTDDSTSQASDRDFVITPTGTLNIDGLKIKEHLYNSPKRYFVRKATDLEVICDLGAGACGMVKKVFHKQSKRVLACKCVNLTVRERLKQFAQEVKILTDLGHHPNIVKLYGTTLQLEECRILLVMEFMDYGSLDGVIRKYGPMPEPLCASVSRDLLSGLAFLHQNRLLHRDIKPENALLNSKYVVKLSDFGITKSFNDTIDSTQTQIGTTIYMSPERINGEKYSFKSDIWGLGCTIYTLAMGEPPFESNQSQLALIAEIASGKKPTLPNKFSRYFRSFICSTTDV